MANGGDYYLTCHDFDEYVATQERIDVEYQNKDEWDRKCIENICNMGFFSSDRSIHDYANDIWGISPLEVPQPSIEKEKHFVSTSNLALQAQEN